MIEVDNLSRSFGRIRAVDDISFRVEKGEIVGFLGPNGAGKTTTMRLLTGFIAPTSGDARVAGYDVREQSMEVKKLIGYLPENPPLYHEMSVRSYLTFVAEVKGVPRRRRAGRVAEVMEMVTIGDIAGRLVGNISKGYRQRVALGQALVHDPPVLIMDEPTVGLDPRQIIEIRELIKGLAGEKTILISSHILPEVSATCERVIIINRGRIVAIDTQEELSKHVAGAERIYILVKGEGATVSAAIRGIGGVLTVERKGTADGGVAFEVESDPGSDIREPLFRAMVAGEWPILEMRPIGASLEEVFMRLTTQEEDGR